MSDRSTSQVTRPARICMPSWRQFKRMAYYGGLYEAEDVLLEVDDVDLLLPTPTQRFHLWERLYRNLFWRGLSRPIVNSNPGLTPIRLTREYDAFVFPCLTWSDLLHLNAIEGWKDQCRVTICYIDEVWASSLDRFDEWLKVARRFDYVITPLEHTAERLSKEGVSCRWVPIGIDTLRFTPLPDMPARVIDFYSIGRRVEAIHDRLLRLADRGNSLYIYDTVQGVADGTMPSHVEHRKLLARLAKRSQYFVVAPAKWDRPLETGGQIEIGYRYFEGATAGAVLLGQSPLCRAFDDLFGWPEAVIEVNPDGSDLLDTLNRLAAEPERLETISVRNASQALRRHDWAYRWRQILALAGLEPGPRLLQRERCLTELAAAGAERLRHGLLK